MTFDETRLPGAFIVGLEPRADERGFFARAFCCEEFEARGLNPVVAQTNVSHNVRAGTVRGLHFQYPPDAETKFVRCTRGAIVDVIVDLRPESPSYLRHVAVELTAGNRRALYVPERCAHGYQVLCDDTEVVYQVGAPYVPGAEGGLRYCDPRLGIEWPLAVSAVSEKDAAWPLLADAEPILAARMAPAILAAPTGGRA